jgi:inner membrane protein
LLEFSRVPNTLYVMASFGHVAVGLLIGQLHGGRGERAGEQRPSLATMATFTGLAMLPDADVIMVALGTSDRGVLGHRGASHSLPLALLLGLLVAYVMQRYGWPVLRTAVMATAAVASHAVLDLLGEGGRGLPVLWPFVEMRFQSPVRIFPDAPRWPATLSGPGITNIAIEILVFSPLTVYALWPRLATSVARLVQRRPAVELVAVSSPTAEPSASSEPAPAPAPAAMPAAAAAAALAYASSPAPDDDVRVASTAEFGPPAPVAPSTAAVAGEPSTERDPPLRSAG